MNVWMGVVENRNDPLKISRVQVRIIGQHTPDKTLIPTSDLPWAFCIMPTNDPSSLHIKEADFVVGTYLDGENAQQPIIFGVINGIPDQLLSEKDGFSDPRTSSELSTSPKPPKSISVSSSGVTITEQNATRYPYRLDEPTTPRLARNENISDTSIQLKKETVSKSIPLPFLKTWDEPETPYSAKYPYNRVMETESGHIVEFDDTPGAERIHIYHRSGTSDEIHPSGTRVTRTHGDSFEIVIGDNQIYVTGDCNITAKNSINIKAGKDINIEAGGKFNVKVDQSIAMQAGMKITHWTQGPLSLNGLPININGPSIAPLGVTPGAMVSSESSTTVPLETLPAPVAAEPGNVVLDQRPGANMGNKKPNEVSTQTPTPEGIPVPKVANTEPVPTITTTEGSDVMIRALNRANITDPIQRAMIYSQAHHESKGFKTLFEDFRFTDKGLIKTWPSRFNANNVSQYVKNPEKIANRAYGGRMGNGDEASGDGWKYRGRGFIMLTGKENYLEASKYFNQDFVKYPDAVAVPDMAADLAIWYFKKGKKTGYKGSYSDILAATKFVNGGTIGLEDRTKRFELAKANTTVTTFNSAIV